MLFTYPRKINLDDKQTGVVNTKMEGQTLPSHKKA
jgi:hypothetical protein